VPQVKLQRSRFVGAILVAVAVVLSAPFAGQIRGWIRTTFPGHMVAIVTALAAVLLLAAVTAAVVRIRERRLARYGTILLALAIAAAYSLYSAGSNPESNAVERFHFLEYGLITLLFYRAWRPLGDAGVLLLPMLAGLIVGTAEEWLQWFIPNRVGELRDIFLNAVAIVTGLLFSAALEPLEHFRWTIGAPSARRVGRVAAATVLAIAAFIHVVHLGYDIRDDEAGSFTSRYAPDALPALQARKLETWRTDPPPLKLRRLSREDQFLSEGLAHVRWRNKQWDAGNARAAWHENRILEKYFAPVLDTPTYEGAKGHRWPAEQRADAEARRAATPAPHVYVSEAYPYRILTWPKPFYWVTVGIIVLVLVLPTLRGWRRRRTAA
jgi:VanZ family protein